MISKVTTTVMKHVSDHHSPMQRQRATTVHKPLLSRRSYPLTINHLKPTSEFPTPDSSYSKRSLDQRLTNPYCIQVRRNRAPSPNSKRRSTKMTRMHRECSVFRFTFNWIQFISEYHFQKKCSRLYQWQCIRHCTSNRKQTRIENSSVYQCIGVCAENSLHHQGNSRQHRLFNQEEFSKIID